MKWLARFIFVALFLLLLTPCVTPASALSPNALPDILITGRVTAEDSGAPLANISIVLVDSSFPIDSVGYTVTDASGYYTVTQTTGNSWWLLFDPREANYFGEYYNDIPLAAGESQFSYAPLQTPVFTYAPGMVRSGIDAALRAKGQSQIRGRITAAPDATPLAQVKVNVFDTNGKHLSGYTGYTDSSGVYTVTQLIAGTYKLRYDYDKIEPEEYYVAEYSGGVTSVAEAEGIEVGNNETVDDVDITLPLGGAIKGYATSSLTGGHLDPWIYVYDQADQLVSVVFQRLYIHDYYTVPNLAPGQYRLFFEDSYFNQHRSEYYNDQSTLDQAQPITVEAGEVTEHINVSLVYTPNVVSIATSKALPNSIVVATDDKPAARFTTDGGQNWQPVATTPWTPAGVLRYFYATLGLTPREGLSGRRILYNDSQRIYRSGDLGATWSEEAPHYPCDGNGARIEFRSLVASPIDTSRFYVIENCSIPSDMGSTSFSWLTVSTDGGVSWQPRPVMNGTQEFQGVAQIVPSPVAAGRLYVSGGYNLWLQSDDYGENWQTRDFPIHELVPDGQNVDYLYGWVPSYGPPYPRTGMRSEDGGENWVEWAQQPCPTYSGSATLLALPTESKVLFTQCQQGFFRSDNGGDSWTRISGENERLLTLDLGVPGRLLLGKEGELWASTDKGESWQLLMDVNGQSINQDRVPIYLPSVSAQEP